MKWNELKKEALRYGKNLEKQPELLADLALLAARFPTLSPVNLIALQLQCPNAQALRPAGDWMNEKVQIRVSQKVVHLFQATTASSFQRDGETLPVNRATPEEKYRFQTGKLSVQSTQMAIPHSFFDITQTKLPLEKYPKYVSSSFSQIGEENRWQSALLFARDMDFQVKEQQFSSPQIHSRYHEEGFQIELSGGLTGDLRTAALLHELAAGILIRTSTEKTIPQIREFESETLYAGLAHAFGIETGNFFAENLRSICGKLNPEQVDIGESFNRIRKAHSFTMSGITDSYVQYLEKDAAHEMKAPDKSVSANFLQDL